MGLEMQPQLFGLLLYNLRAQIHINITYGSALAQILVNFHKFSTTPSSCKIIFNKQNHNNHTPSKAKAQIIHRSKLRTTIMYRKIIILEKLIGLNLKLVKKLPGPYQRLELYGKRWEARLG